MGKLQTEGMEEIVMKRITRKLVFILAMALLFCNVPSSAVSAAPKKYVKSLSVSKKNLKVNVGEKKAFSYKVKVKGSVSKKILVKASNSNVKVSVKKNGKIIVLGKKYGTSKITLSTKGKNRRGKKLKKTIRIKIAKKKTSQKKQVTPKPTENGNAAATKKVTRKEWISAVMKVTNYCEQKELFDCNKNGTPIYSFVDIAGLAESGIIETAVKYQIIPESGGDFKPNEATDREFLAVTSVRAIGLAVNSQDADCRDKGDLKYEAEDAIAVNLKLLALIGDKFLPERAITVKEKDNAIRILAGIINSRRVNAHHADVIQYNEDVARKNEVTDYTVTNDNGIYTIQTTKGSSLKNITKGDKFLLPATDKYPEGIALIASSDAQSLGAGTAITGIPPKEISEFLDTVDIQGTAEADAEHATGVSGVSTLEVISGEKQATRKNPDRKKAKADDSIPLNKRYEYKIPEIGATISFELKELVYKINFDKKGVKELYIGMPSVCSLDTDLKKSKNFSKKIGDIPMSLPANFSVNLQVYAEVSVEGRIKINFRMDNNIGVQYLNGQFYLEKHTSPSLDMFAEADVEAGTKIQLGLFWMKKIQELFGNDDPRPIYNVHTRWGLHGDAKLQNRNDQYTSFKDLKCIDLGYYLYGTVGIGDGSFLGDEFDLKKIWEIFEQKNSPLKGNLHFENGKKVDKCTYKVGAIAEELKKYAENYSYYCVNQDSYNKYIVGNGEYSYPDEMSIMPLTFDISDYEFCYEILDEMPVMPLTFDINDYDFDGNPELLIVQSCECDGTYAVYPHERLLYLEMYEYENGEVIKKSTSKYRIERGYGKPFYVSAVAMVEGETSIYTFERNNALAIAMESHDTKSRVGGGDNMQFWLLKYNGNSFETIGFTDYPYAWRDDRLEEVEKDCASMGLKINAESIVYGKEKLMDYIANPKIIGKSATKITEDVNWDEVWEEDPFGIYKIAEMTFSK